MGPACQVPTTGIFQLNTLQWVSASLNSGKAVVIRCWSTRLAKSFSNSVLPALAFRCTLFSIYNPQNFVEADFASTREHVNFEKVMNWQEMRIPEVKCSQQVLEGDKWKFQVPQTGEPISSTLKSPLSLSLSFSNSCWDANAVRNPQQHICEINCKLEAYVTVAHRLIIIDPRCSPSLAD